MSKQDTIAELTVAKCEQTSLVKELVEKQGRQGLVPKKVQVNRGGKTYIQTVFVKPTSEDAPSGKGAFLPRTPIKEPSWTESGQKLDDLANEAWDHMNEQERRKALGGVTTDYWKKGWGELSNKDRQIVIQHLKEKYPESVKVE